MGPHKVPLPHEKLPNLDLEDEDGENGENIETDEGEEIEGDAVPAEDVDGPEIMEQVLQEYNHVMAALNDSMINISTENVDVVHQNVERVLELLQQMVELAVRFNLILYHALFAYILFRNAQPKAYVLNHIHCKVLFLISSLSICFKQESANPEPVDQNNP